MASSFAEHAAMGPEYYGQLLCSFAKIIALMLDSVSCFPYDRRGAR
jgi:hypothetical protein